MVQSVKHKTNFIPHLHTVPQWAVPPHPHGHGLPPSLPPSHSQDQHQDEKDPLGSLGGPGVCRPRWAGPLLPTGCSDASFSSL